MQSELPSPTFQWNWYTGLSQIMGPSVHEKTFKYQSFDKRSNFPTHINNNPVRLVDAVGIRSVQYIPQVVPACLKVMRENQSVRQVRFTASIE